MNTLTNSTIKSVSVSIILHGLFIVLGSWAFYNNSIQNLELTGNAGGKKVISLSGINFSVKKSVKTRAFKKSSNINEKIVKKNDVRELTLSKPSDVSTVGNSIVNSEVSSGQSIAGSEEGLSSGNGSGAGTGVGDFDHGYLFGQIKNFFESRLGSTLNIRENQLIKIKVTLSKEGEILDAILIQGKLDMSVLRRVISVAKNIPLKSYWKTRAYPQELIIPLILTPS